MNIHIDPDRVEMVSRAVCLSMGENPDLCWHYYKTTVETILIVIEAERCFKGIPNDNTSRPL